MNTVIIKALAIALLCMGLVFGGVILYDRFNPPPATQSINVVENIPTTQHPIKSIRVYDKKKVSKKVSLPESIKSDPNQQVVAVTQVDKPSRVTAITDTSTGSTTQYVEKITPPLVSIKPAIEIGLSYYPVHSPDLGDFALDASYRMIRLSEINLGLKGEIDNRGNYRIGARAYVEFE